MKRLLVRYDVDGWAFHRRALGLARYAPGNCRVVLMSDADVLRGGVYDAVMLCAIQQEDRWWRPARIVRFAGANAWLHDYFDPADWRTKAVNTNRHRRRARNVVRHADAAGAQNSALHAMLATTGTPVMLMPYCVDREHFYPGNRAERQQRLAVGWCGQLTGGDHNPKGYHEVLVPLRARLGSRFRWLSNTADFHRALGTEELRAWYNAVDVFLCTSCSEGGPQPPFEAAACGCAVVSTDVGQVADWDDLRRLGLVVPGYANAEEAARTVDAMAALLVSLDEDRGRLEKLRGEVAASVGRCYDAAREYPKHVRFILGDE